MLLEQHLEAVDLLVARLQFRIPASCTQAGAIS
jgi:hypothetical protein